MNIWKDFHHDPDLLQKEIDIFEATIDETIFKINDPVKVEQIVFEQTVEGRVRERISRLIQQVNISKLKNTLSHDDVKISDTLMRFQRTIQRLSTLR